MITPSHSNTRDNLLAAAIRIFARQGYRKATVREICNAAGSANVNSINYYFGSKDLLYREILEILFTEYDRRESPMREDMPSERQLYEYILMQCAMLYQHSEFGEDLMAIYIAETVQPSPFMEALIDQYNRPRVKKNLAMIQALLGPEAPLEMVRNCLVSVVGQILYHAYNQKVFGRLFPDHPGMEKVYADWADHVYRFSMGGIEALKRKIKLKET